jgi:hypothetical protein
MLAAMHTCLALFAGARSPRIALQHRAGSAQMLDLHAVDGLYQSFPYPAAFATCATKAACSDAISQKTVERVVAENGAVTEHTFCMSRNAAFTLYGGLYQGCAQYYIFNELYPSLFGTSTDVATVAIKVAFDQLVLTPFLCTPSRVRIHVVCVLPRALPAQHRTGAFAARQACLSRTLSRRSSSARP